MPRPGQILGGRKGDIEHHPAHQLDLEFLPTHNRVGHLLIHGRVEGRLRLARLESQRAIERAQKKNREGDNRKNTMVNRTRKTPALGTEQRQSGRGYCNTLRWA
jgi:hypothetical protein